MTVSSKRYPPEHSPTENNCHQKPVGTPFTGHNGGVWAVAVAQIDGRPVLICGSGDGTVRAQDLAAAHAHSRLPELWTGYPPRWR